MKKHYCVLIAFLLSFVMLVGCASEIPPYHVTSSPGSVVVQQETPEPQPVTTTLRFSATGDNLIHDGLYNQANRRANGDGYDFTYLYENIAPFYKDYDINWINQETLITDAYAPAGYPCFCTPEAMGHQLYDMGFRVISMSNNHAYDKGAGGIAATRSFWASMPQDVVTTGFWPIEDTSNIPLQTVDGVVIAYLSYTEHTNGLPTPGEAEASIIYTSEEDVIEQQIKSARAQADVVVVGVHWGTEGSHTVNDAQRTLGQKMADWGADIIIGTHPHVVQSIEMLTTQDNRQVPIAYSLGNYVSVQAYADNMIGAILTFTISKTTTPQGESTIQLSDVKAVPTVMHYDSNYSNARIYLYRDYTPELARSHGVLVNSPQFNYDYITQVLEENISPEFLQLT